MTTLEKLQQQIEAQARVIRDQTREITDLRGKLQRVKLDRIARYDQLHVTQSEIEQLHDVVRQLQHKLSYATSREESLARQVKSYTEANEWQANEIKTRNDKLRATQSELDAALEATADLRQQVAGRDANIEELGVKVLELRKQRELDAHEGRNYRATLHKLIDQLPRIVDAGSTTTQVTKLKADLEESKRELESFIAVGQMNSNYWRTELEKREKIISDQTNELMELRQKLRGKH